VTAADATYAAEIAALEAAHLPAFEASLIANGGAGALAIEAAADEEFERLKRLPASSAMRETRARADSHTSRALLLEKHREAARVAFCAPRVSQAVRAQVRARSHGGTQGELDARFPTTEALADLLMQLDGVTTDVGTGEGAGESKTNDGSGAALAVAIPAETTQNAPAFVQFIDVVVRLQAQTSDYLVPLDRYLRAAAHKFAMGEEFSSFRVTPPVGLVPSSGTALGQHAALVRRAVSLAEEQLRFTLDDLIAARPAQTAARSKMGKAALATLHHYSRQRSLVEGTVAGIVHAAQGQIEAHRPVVKLGRVFTGRVAGSLVLAEPPPATRGAGVSVGVGPFAGADSGDTVAAHARISRGGLANMYEALALRHCVLPWRSLLVRWYDLRGVHELQMPLVEIWMAANLAVGASLPGPAAHQTAQRLIQRVNPWDALDDLEYVSMRCCQRQDFILQALGAASNLTSPSLPRPFSFSQAAKRVRRERSGTRVHAAAARRRARCGCARAARYWC